MRRLWIGIPWVLALWSIPLAPTEAVGYDTLRETVTRLVDDRLALAGPGSLVVGVIHDGRSLVVGRGDSGRPDGGPPDGRTVFQIASLTKPFTGTIMAELMRSGRLDASDPLERHLTRVPHVPDYEGRPIRLRDLATHTAGLPNVPETPRFSWSRLDDPRNPYKPLTRDEVATWLSGYSLPVPPGSRFRYSNVGMAVLGEALTAASGVSYETLLKRVVTDRFGMRDTSLRLTAEQRARKAVGHARGRAVPDWEAPAMQSSFGLYSTADDLLRWLHANLGDCPNVGETNTGKGGCEAGTAATLALAQSVQVDGRRLADPGALGAGAMALGWFVAWAADGTPILWHSGSTGGFNAYIAFSRAHRWAVVALTNSDPDRVTADSVVADIVRRFEARPEVAAVVQ
ncbi:D-alanyl-D-alanine-carboxypeptidase/D-alanyl-D-alanine-endopeptidase [Azospirillum agricola]|uniref:serine hydrolase domain-containing protein n=1 Tax=Azospirillum agricola TaxID=1720247 RepID=UPI001AEA99E7|nr:serine hydrolase [Azospirillum agricola]MBP2232817.1 D-alanyl-D-alanine-carboxypeptidase/D-alanyl-D-alanine-endopeptidase [Azospirillum agricola]